MPDPHRWNVTPVLPRNAAFRLTMTSPELTATGPTMDMLLKFSTQLQKLGYQFVRLERVEP